MLHHLSRIIWAHYKCFLCGGEAEFHYQALYNFDWLLPRLFAGRQCWSWKAYGVCPWRTFQDLYVPWKAIRNAWLTIRRSALEFAEVTPGGCATGAGWRRLRSFAHGRMGW